MVYLTSMQTWKDRRNNQTIDSGRGGSEVIESLREACNDPTSALSRGDREFGLSLCAGYDKHRSLSPKQTPWVFTLLERAEATATGTMAPKQVEHMIQSIGSASAIFKLFENAAERSIQWPSIRLLVDGQQLKLTYVKSSDSININRNGSDGRREWLGGLKRNGDLNLSRKYTAPLSLTKELIAFSIDPSQAGGVMGKRMRSCCFCGRDLTTRDSLYYGYGPICAEKWGLEWGEAVSHLKAEAVTALPGDFSQDAVKGINHAKA